MSTAEPAYEPESPLDVLSRAASLVESGASSGESQSETEPSPPRASAPASLKELHPKFRKMSASGGPMVYGRASCATPPPSYTASLAASGHTSSPEEAPLDFSIRKRSLSPSSDGPPPYKYANPLRQHSPPLTRASQSPSSSLPSSVPSSSSSHQLPVNPAPSYYRPPPYPRTPSPPPPPPPSEARPPPPTYEAAMACKPTSPRVSLTSTSPTFMTLTTRPSPTTIKTGSSEYSSASTTSPTKTDSGARPSVICTGPSASRKEDGPHVANLFKKEENKENKDLSETPRQSRKREVTIVEGEFCSKVMKVLSISLIKYPRRKWSGGSDGGTLQKITWG